MDVLREFKKVSDLNTYYLTLYRSFYYLKNKIKTVQMTLYKDININGTLLECDEQFELTDDICGYIPYFIRIKDGMKYKIPLDNFKEIRNVIYFVYRSNECYVTR